jgi:hypothetical protein
VYRKKDESTMKKLLGLLIVGGLLCMTTGCPAPSTDTKKDKGTSGTKAATEPTSKAPTHPTGKKSDDKGTKPDDKGTKPDDKGTKPDDKGTKPDDKGTKPDDKDKKKDK